MLSDGSVFLPSRPNPKKRSGSPGARPKRDAALEFSILQPHSEYAKAAYRKAVICDNMNDAAANGVVDEFVALGLFTEADIDYLPCPPPNTVNSYRRSRVGPERRFVVDPYHWVRQTEDEQDPVWAPELRDVSNSPYRFGLTRIVIIDTDDGSGTVREDKTRRGTSTSGTTGPGRRPSPASERTDNTATPTSPSANGRPVGAIGPKRPL